jgi:pyruvate carboxylase
MLGKLKKALIIFSVRGIQTVLSYVKFLLERLDIKNQEINWSFIKVHFKL